MRNVLGKNCKGEPWLLCRQCQLAFVVLSGVILEATCRDEESKRDVQRSIFDIDLGSLTHLPLWEPTVEEYFPQRPNDHRDEQGLAAPVVLKNLTNEQFVYHARRGYPILVEDWGDNMIYNGWTGKDFATEFPFGYMKAEYIQDMPGFRRKDHDTKIIDDELRFKLGTFRPDGKTLWHNFSRPASKKYRHDPLKPITGPYVWHVKDELTAKQKKLVQARFEAPRFLRDPLNSQKLNDSFEIWFSPGAGTGAGAHNDGYCESVVSLQLRGDKKWRKMLEPDMTFLHSFDEFDGGVYEAGFWEPDLGFFNRQGGAVIWPPGYLHETKTAQPPDGECGTAITMQFSFPQPVQFLRAFLPRLSLSSEVGHCVAGQWSSYISFYVPGIRPTPSAQKMGQQLAAIFKNIDLDVNGKITVEEVSQYFESGSTRELNEEKHRFPQKHWDLVVKFKAQDTVAYHDADNDMTVSKQELWDSLVQWNVVRIRMREGLKFVNKADEQGLKEFEKSLDYLRRKPASFPKKLRPELYQLFSLRNGTKILPTLKGVNSFSDQEFFSQARDRIEELYREQRAGQEL